jgi:zinc transporter
MKMQTFAPAGQPGATPPPVEWIVLNGRDEADRAWIETQSRLDDAVKLVVSKPPRHNERIHLGAATVLNLVRTDDPAGDEQVGLSIVVEAHRVLTLSYGTEAIVGEVFERQASGASPLGTSRILSLLVGALVKPLEPKIARLSERIDALEDAAMAESDDPTDGSVIEVGREVLSLRRYLAPMHAELAFLASDPDELPGVAEPKYLRRAAESLARLVSALDSSHNRVLLILNQLRSRGDAKQARSMHRLTLVATVFLPLGFITGLLGMNVAGIPAEHDPYAFWTVCALLIGVAVVAFLLLRSRRWM